MGDPIRILDLAEELIRLSGLTPYEDIDIIFTGLRPGEKLFEELLVEGEGVLATSHEKIRVLAPVHISMEAVQQELDVLYNSARAENVPDSIASLKRVVPEFKPSYHFNGDAPHSFQRVRPDLFPIEERKVIQLQKRA